MSTRSDAPGTSLDIRPAAPADYDAIVEVWTAAGLSTRPTGRDAREPFLRQLEQFPGTYLVAVDSDRVIGAVLGTHDGRKGWINRLAVHPDHQGRGVAVSLIAACDAAIRALGIEIVAALVEPENEASIRVFRRAGFLDDAPVTYLRKLGRADI